MTVSFFWRKLYIDFTHLLHKSLRAISLQTTDNGVVIPIVHIIVKVIEFCTRQGALASLQITTRQGQPGAPVVAGEPGQSEHLARPGLLPLAQELLAPLSQGHTRPLLSPAQAGSGRLKGLT